MDQDKKLKAARRNAYCLLRLRPRSESEMRARLKVKRYDEPTIEAVIGPLKAQGEIDDAKFADYWIESRMNVNPAGEALLRNELKAKCISDELIDAAIRKISLVYDEYAVALQAAQVRAAKLKAKSAQEAKKSLFGYLMRRGFDYDTVSRVVDKVINEN